MNFPIFAAIVLLGACGLNWLEDEAKKSGKPIPQFIMVISVFGACFFAFVISIII